MRGNICDNSDTENWLGTVPKGPPLTCSSVCNATFGCGYFGSSPNDDCALFKRCDAQIRAPNLREIGGVMMYRKELRPAGVLACGDTDYFFAGAGQDECPNGGARYETASESECLSIWNEHCWPSIELTISNALGMFSVTDKTTSPSGCYANFGPELSAGHYNQEVGVAALDTDDRILCSRTFLQLRGLRCFLPCAHALQCLSCVKHRWAERVVFSCFTGDAPTRFAKHTKTTHPAKTLRDGHCLGPGQARHGPHPSEAL